MSTTTTTTTDTKHNQQLPTKMPTDFLFSRYFPGIKMPDAHNFEINRQLSFDNKWHNRNVFPSSLAKAGFYYNGPGDEVKCCFCDLRCSRWAQGQVPLEVHRRLNPNCYLFTETLSGDVIGPNIPVPLKTFHNDPEIVKTYVCNKGFSCSAGILETGIAEEDNNINVPAIVDICAAMRIRWRERRHSAGEVVPNVPKAVDGSSLYTARHGDDEGGCTGAEMLPQFSTPNKRLQTFAFKFPLRPLVDGLSTQGFLYTGHKDICICYHCGLGVYEWCPGDDPKIAHARWSPQCRHLRNVVSRDFVAAISREMASVGAAE